MSASNLLSVGRGPGSASRHQAQAGPAAAWARRGARPVLPLVLALLPVLAPAATITLTGTVRDFNARNTSFAGVGGHSDFNSSTADQDDRGIAATNLGADGRPVYSSAKAHPTVTSASSFYQWFHNDSTVNRSESLNLVLTSNAATKGAYQSSTSAFFPIDGRLMNQQTGSPTHNYLFTTEFHTTFTYQSANNDTFSFLGNDDVFAFINGILAVDLGGVHTTQKATVDLNTFALSNGMVSGRTYNLDFFQASRRSSGSNFVFETTTALQTASGGGGSPPAGGGSPPAGGGSPPAGVVPEPGMLALLGIGLAGVGACRRRARRRDARTQAVDA